MIHSGNSFSPRGGDCRDRSVSQDSTDSRGIAAGSMSGSLTAFSILESARPGMGVVLGQAEQEGALSSARVTREAISNAVVDTGSGRGVAEGQEGIVRRISGADEEVQGGGDGGNEDEAFAFELDLDE